MIVSLSLLRPHSVSARLTPDSDSEGITGMQERTLTEHQDASGIDRPARLSAVFVKSVKAPGRYGDGRGGYGLSFW